VSASRRLPDGARRSAARARLAAIAPRVLALLALALLAALGLRDLVAPAAAPAPAPIVVQPAEDLGARAVAEAFARAYLAWDPGDPGDRSRALQKLAARDLGEGAGLRPPAGGPGQTVGWTAVLADRLGPGGTRVITVAADTSAGPRYLDVPVTREPGGALVVAADPALVGAPRGDPGRALREEEPIEDPALVVVVRRAVANYLTGDRDNLLADLAPGAAIVMPAALRGIQVGEVTWADRERVVAAVAVRALLPGGATAELRYVLALVDRGRWLVRSIGGG
jgi:hypothetical protein